MSQQKQSNKPVALITGAAQRLGAATAKKLHLQGWNIIIQYRNSKTAAIALSESLNSIRANSAATLHNALDSVAKTQQLAQSALLQFGRLDALINNASAFFPTAVTNHTETDWDLLMGINLKVPYFLSCALAPELKRNQGAIINMADIYHERPLKQHTAYCVSKAGIAMLTKSMALELAPEVRVNAVSPGAILWHEHADSTYQQEILSKVPLNRMGDMNDIAETVCFLTCNNQYITGQIIAVDGGRSLRI